MKNLTDFRKTVETGVDPRLGVKGRMTSVSDYTPCSLSQSKVKNMAQNCIITRSAPI